MYIGGDGALHYGHRDALTFASHNQMSVARKGDRYLRGKQPPVQPVNNFLDAMREDWAEKTAAERIDYIHSQLAVLRDPLQMLDESDHITCSGFTLGELYHARVVLTRLLPFMVDAASSQGASGVTGEGG